MTFLAGPDNRAVWKFELQALMNELWLPAGAELLYATEQRDGVVVYALVDPRTVTREIRRVLVVGTGHDQVSGNVRPLGVARLSGGTLMFHVLEVLDSQ